MRVRLSPLLGDRMAGITPLFDNLWNEYIVWSFLVGGFTFIWLYHHSLWYKSEEGEDWDNKDGIRDAQESRGLGDVYKRQPYEGAFVPSAWGSDGRYHPSV